MTISLERYEAALRGAEPVTYHKDRCPAATSLGEFPCDLQRCGAEVEHREKVRRWKAGEPIAVVAAAAPGHVSATVYVPREVTDSREKALLELEALIQAVENDLHKPEYLRGTIETLARAWRLRLREGLR